MGEWVKFPTTAEELKEVFKRIGIGQKDDFGQPYEEWFITDYDCYVDGLYSKLGEYENLDELNYLASKLDEMSKANTRQFQAGMEMGDHYRQPAGRSSTSPRIWIVMRFTPISRTMTIWAAITSKNWTLCRCQSTCRITSTMRPTAGTLRWRKTAPSRIRAMCGIRVTVSMSITTVSAAVSPTSTG